MSNDRKKFSDNEKMLLFNEVDGRCPLCGESLKYTKNGKIYKLFEIAHIYPVNPMPEEEQLLKNEERLSENVNSLDNVIAVCTDCHTKFDKPRTVEEYRKWVKMKRKLLQETAVKNIYSVFTIEEEIGEVLKKLNCVDMEEELASLSYTSLKLAEKMNETMPHIIKRTIKNDVVDYFEYIRNIFVNIDKKTPYKFETLASQIKSFYCKTMQINQNQEFVYNALVDWINEKTNDYSRRACEIVIAYFIQDCEVFS